MRKIKRTYKLALALLVAVLSISTVSFAAAFTTEVRAEDVDIKDANPVTDFEWNTDNGYAIVTKYVGKDEKAVIPAEYDGMPVKEIGEQVFMNTGVKSVVVPDTVDKLADSAFFWCTQLESIKLPKQLKYMGKSCFSYCGKLKEITLPEGLEKLEMLTFNNCDSLEKIRIPEGVVTLENSVFYGCDSLTEVSLPSSLETIEYSCFYKCNALQTIVLPDDVTLLGYGVFRDCNKLVSVNIPAGLEGLKFSTFENCTSLTELVIPKNITKIDDDTFKGIKDTITLKVYNDSYGLKFAKEKEFKYTIIPEENGWMVADGKSYWYENSVRQGTYSDPYGVLGDGTVRGREIYDPSSDGWYWLDAVYDGAKACSKEVWMPYIYQGEQNWSEEELRNNANNSGDMAEQVIREIKNQSGKWVRYDANGKMYKGWYTVEGVDSEIYPDQVGNTYYYDPKTGLMAKGEVEIDGMTYYFNEVTGVKQ